MLAISHLLPRRQHLAANRRPHAAGLQALMTEPSSPISDFYPTEFVIDSEGKRADWEGVVLIPFIDVARLVQAASSVPLSSLSNEERARNELGNVMIFTHDPGQPLRLALLQGSSGTQDSLRLGLLRRSPAAPLKV